MLQYRKKIFTALICTTTYLPAASLPMLTSQLEFLSLPHHIEDFIPIFGSVPDALIIQSIGAKPVEQIEVAMKGLPDIFEPERGPVAWNNTSNMFVHI